MKRRAQILAFSVLAGAAGGTGAETRPPYGDELEASLLGEPATVDPVLARSEADVALASLVFDTLYRFGDAGRPIPHLASAAPEPSEEHERSVRIELRPGVEFHDGKTLGAEDVARSLQRARASAAGWLLAPVESVWPEGDTIVVELSSADVDVERLLAAPATAITPEGRPPDPSQLIGSGPFRAASLSRARRRLELRSFDRHFAGRPYVDRIAFRWYPSAGEEARRYEAGDTHLSLRGEVAFRGNRPKYETRVAEGPAATLTYVGFGRRTPVLAESAAFRRALSLAIARRGFRALGAGEQVIPAVMPLAPDLGGPAIESESAFAHPEKAGEMLRRAAGRSAALRKLLDGDASSLEVLVDASRPADRRVAEKVARALYRLGIDAHIAEAPARELARRGRRGECDLYIGQLAAPLPSPDVQLAAALAAGGQPKQAARLISGTLDRGRALERFETKLPIVPLFHRALRIHHRADVYGVSFEPAGRARYADLFFFGEPVRASAGAR